RRKRSSASHAVTSIISPASCRSTATAQTLQRRRRHFRVSSPQTTGTRPEAWAQRWRMRTLSKMPSRAVVRCASFPRER
ncbi:hypothetical protein LTR66_010386, partial [Elasticomyces elasticus]